MDVTSAQVVWPPTPTLLILVGIGRSNYVLYLTVTVSTLYYVVRF